LFAVNVQKEKRLAYCNKIVPTSLTIHNTHKQAHAHTRAGTNAMKLCQRK